MPTKKDQCSYCDNAIDFPRLRICRQCYDVFYYWKRKSVKQMIHRTQRLEVYQRRMEAMLGNVSTITRKKRRAG